jgi:hypothetical protein
LNTNERVKRPGVLSRHWNQLLIERSSARRWNPRSLMSNPGFL